MLVLVPVMQQMQGVSRCLQLRNFEVHYKDDRCNVMFFA